MAPSAAPSPANAALGNSSDKTRRVEDDEVKPYVIVSDLGKGSFATVYRGYHEQTHRQVAIKTVSRAGLSPKLFDNLKGEIEILKTLSHRHITRLLDIVHAERNIYLIIEYCAGGDLSNYIKKRGRVEGLEYIPSPGAAPVYYPHPRTGGLDEIVVRSFLRQLARALKFLRQRNLIHRDIKPQNLLLNPAAPDELARGHPLGVPILKVADFGFARSLPQAMMAETLCGSPLYMAPEILRYEKYDAKADLWSVGAVLYEMAVGKPPFRASNHIELIKKIDNTKGIKFPDEDPRAGEEVKPVPSDVKKLIRGLLKRLPAERCSFEDFFGSTALAKSKFPRPAPEPPVWPDEPEVEYTSDGRPVIPEHHKVIPPEVLDPKAMIPPSKFNFRKREIVGTPPQDGSSSASPTGIVEVPRSPRASPRRESSTLPKPSSTEGPIPGETEEDGMLRREYVLVGDRKVVEMNRAVDEISTARRRPLRDRRMQPTPSPLVDSSPRNDYASSGAPSPASANTTFPPPPNPNAPPPLSSSPSSIGGRTASNALTRALNLASKKLFGSSGARSSPYYREYTPSTPSSRRQSILSGRGQALGLQIGGERDPMEDELLASLEELAQKTDVLTHWADEMYEYVKAVPQKPLPDPSKFSRREGEPERHAAKRKNADIQAEYNAMTCVALYMLLMSFSQNGVTKLCNYYEHLRMRDPDGECEMSEGFDEALVYFEEHFRKCHDRAALVKTWLPAQYTGPPTFLDQLVYDRALMLSRTAARKELLDQATSPDECEKLYEESLWCLYALQHDLLQKDNPFMDEDRETISTWIKRTKLRLVRCRVRMGMNDRERLKDARLDKNLDDVPRDPPPWEVPVLPAERTESNSRRPSFVHQS
ncbi:Pkinase-domain-containing protein [Laetiporus sulphureus 93-53]|uniref:non-specific serine/threonine protein kinase n=1 Tax=Laetiporus sulphureus 93-53 TaxID=1314785 RepID=A0A165F152_9APHY|nr:Pkinase-domain-containing protein [Laetiporus sulphureus 93-53]KZT08148.1 Pkinase-domain-containing protein [Laetiporus sulphureus 93-53]